ncbi:hypothetical protein ACFFHH_02240 [Cytobacillus solani]|uniref:ABC-2 transporter permease n=1 Tax=Cytobacillus solani TaxID=1637975 RepID=A0A0Q3QJ66_9BACI|nr:hypothetical protein [Cytobacillus solani]KOP79590.1 hypothetical protein AMS60_17435 [Bacillus sp. FJAT-21945]KQL17616.1 hypothetical protein AN957_02560 [Cytobacillus solani]USK55480.1 hypothetical protein LIS82_02700 [Cytobacillus solani]
MSEWKQARWLAMFEVKASLKGIITLIALSFGLAIFFTEVFSITIMEDVPIVFDVFFLFTFWVLAASFRPKEHQLKRMGGDIWVSPYFIMLNQLPVKKNVLVLSRFISYFTISIPFHILVLILIYTLSSEYRAYMPVGSYLVFSIIWLSFGVLCGSMFPASDVGEKISTLKAIVYSVLFYGGILAVLIVIYYVFNKGIVEMTMYAAKEWPLPSILISILLAAIGLLYYKGYVYKRIDKVDYLH